MTISLHMGTAQRVPSDVGSPLPGGPAEVIRWFFNVPSWIQISGAVLGVALVAALAVLGWRRRSQIGGWLQSRARYVQVGLVTLLVIVAATAAWAGYESYDYVQHANAFCTGCHVMAPAYSRFTRSEHRDLQCHDCHRQSMFASMRQLYLWVADRPEDIGEHSPVPNRVCAECHVQQDPDSTWQRIAATAGHRLHLESDSSALEDVMCVTCHGEEVHRFVPVDQTCGQSGCHDRESTEIHLGEMAGQTGLHCIGCHEFTAPVAEVTATDTARAVLSPDATGCLGCHQMQQILAEFRPSADPHQGECGDCHNPHEQELPRQAFQTCTNAGCHEPHEPTSFHSSLTASAMEECASCHEAHTWTVTARDCEACHVSMR